MLMAATVTVLLAYPCMNDSDGQQITVKERAADGM